MSKSSVLTEKCVESYVSKSRHSGCIPASRFPRESDQRKLFGFPLYRWDVRTGRRLSNIRVLVTRAFRFLRYRSLGHPLICEIVGELHTLLLRIQTIYVSKSYRRGVLLGFLGTIHCDTQYAQLQSCIRDMQCIASHAHWARTLDHRAWVLAWGMGAQFGCDNAHREKLRECLAELLENSRLDHTRDVKG